jgi:hypothetical protein
MTWPNNDVHAIDTAGAPADHVHNTMPELAPKRPPTQEGPHKAGPPVERLPEQN